MLLRFLFFIVVFITFSAGTAHAQTSQPVFAVLAGDEAITVPATTLADWEGNRAWKQREATWNYTLHFFSVAEQQAPETFDHDFKKVYHWLAASTTNFNHEPENAELTIDNEMVTNFKAGKDGSRVDLVRSTHNILEALKAGYSQGSLSISKAPASTKLSDTNSLGIKELLATGTSTFAGSPNNRRHNIKIGVEHMTGILVAPGEEFSFNKFLGPVEEEFGFLPELVIKKEGTIPELGGGLCQVSSTLFRSVMKAGLPVTQRKNHSYAVQYYAPQGTDATIYPGVIDLKFMNDTPGHLLIWPYFKDKNTLLFELYGTRDNRLVQLDTPIQYDRKTDGSMKAMWKRVVINNGKTKTDEFFSNYLPPALFHKEEQFPKPTTEKPTATETNSEVKTETETNGENTESSTETKPENKPETTAPDKEQS